MGCASSAENNGIASFLCEDIPRYEHKQQLVNKYWNNWSGESTQFWSKRDPEWMKHYLRKEMWELESMEKFEFSMTTPQKLEEIFTKHFPDLVFPSNVFKLAVEMAFERSALSLLQAMEMEKILPGEVKSFSFEKRELILHRHRSLPDLYFQSFLSFLSWSMQALPHYQWERAVIEIIHSFQSYALGMAYFHGPLKKAISSSDNLFTHKRASDSLFFDQLAGFHGHPFHPCYKCKIPLSASDIIRYSPEFNPTVHLSVYAIHESEIVPFPSFEEYRIAFWEGLPDHLAIEFRQGLKNYDLSPEVYAPWLCHPINEENVRQLFKDLVEKWHLVRLPMTIEGRPTLAFRTMDILGVKRVKLTTPVQATSLVRYLSPVEANLGAHCRRLRKVLKDMDPNDSFFVARYEWHSFHARFSDNAPDEISQYSYAQARYLSMIIRDHPSMHQRPNHVQISLAGFLASDPHGRTVLSEFLRPISKEGAQNWFKNYVEVCLKGHLDIFLIYGAALESHQQNVVLDLNLKSKQIERTSYHDISGIYWEEGMFDIVFPERDLRQAIYESHDDTINTLPECVANVHHTLFKSNLFTLAKLMSKEFNLNLVELQSIIRTKTREHFEFCRAVGTVKFGDRWVARYKRCEEIFFGKLYVKCLLKMRLLRTQNEQRIQIENPLVENLNVKVNAA